MTLRSWRLVKALVELLARRPSAEVTDWVGSGVNIPSLCVVDMSISMSSSGLRGQFRRGAVSSCGGDANVVCGDVISTGVILAG